MPPVVRAPYKLLVVDDDPITRELLRDALETRGAHVRVSSTAGEARETLVAWHPDAMISDIEMPDVDGYALLRQVRRLPPEQGGATPAIACTGHVRADDRARAMHAGYDAVVAKPVDLGALIDVIVHVAGVRGGSSDDDDAPGDG